MKITEPKTIDQSLPEPLNTDAMLYRILAAVEKDRRRGGLELALAIILSLATLASTWCGYQATLWGGVQNANQASADTAERKAAEDTIVGLQLRTFDAIALSEYWGRSGRKIRNPATRSSSTFDLSCARPLRRALLRECCTTRKGDCYDNAVMESFYGKLKTELVSFAGLAGQGSFATRAEARQAVFEWIEVFYNRQRLHSTLGYRSPAEFEDAA